MRSMAAMKTSNVLTGTLFCTALAWGGIRLGEHYLSRIQESLPTMQQMAVVALATASGAHDARHATKPAPAAAGLTSEQGMPDPVAAGPADTADGSVSVPLAPAVVEFENTEALAGTQQGIVQATLTGNGRERLSAHLRNNSPAPLRVKVPAGQVLESGRNRVVVTHSVEVELMPAKSVDISLSTAALNSSNIVGEASYRFSYHNVDSVDAFLQWAADHAEVPFAAMQTAILALTENLPLSAVAKFAPVNGTPGKLNTEAFRVETGDILAAFSALRDSGANMESIAMALEPQLRIEAMIEPLSREAAKRYYGISEEREWDFWKHELLEGSPSTRHYALFGIARFYPDIAIEMLPKWVREPQTHPVYRLSAVQALADTQRPAALPLLRQIAEELGPQTELGKAAAQAATYLDKRLTELAARPQVVAFRGKNRVTGF